MIDGRGAPNGTRDPLGDSEPVVACCEEAVARLAKRLPRAEIGCLLRVGDTFRHVAHSGRLRMIFEVGREQGGVVWRAADRGEIQLVRDVRSDPDYLASDERIVSEIAAPVTIGGEVVAVLDVEFPERAFDETEAEAVAEAAEQLDSELEPYV
ncbi:MAG: GAF domain-containing protein [Gaiellaceae bacterium]